jgi:methionyl-tRNA formyltransferase
VVAYGLILPQAMLDAPRLGCLNIHASLLPRWRGAAPIQAAILAGDTETGVTIMRMDAGLDTGPMLLSEATPITATTTGAHLHDTLAAIGARLVVRALADLPAPVPQPGDGVTYAPKLGRDDARIDWTQDAVAIERQVRAFDPWPGTFTTLNGAVLKVLAAECAAGAGQPGLVLDDALTVACGHGALRLTRVQAAGRTAMPAATFLRGHPVPADTVLGQ